MTMEPYEEVREAGEQVREAGDLIDTWTLTETRTALNFLCGYAPETIREAHDVIQGYRRRAAERAAKNASPTCTRRHG